MNRAAVGPLSGMFWTKDEVKGSSGVVPSNGGVAERGSIREGGGEHGGEGNVDERCVMISEEVASIGHVTDGVEEEVGGGVGREQCGEEARLEALGVMGLMGGARGVKGHKDFA